MRQVLVIAVLLFAPSAGAQDYGKPPEVLLQPSEDGGLARASMDVRAPPRVVWTLLTNCDHAHLYMRELLSCEILERGEGWELREHRVRGWLFRPVLRNVARVELDPVRRLSFQRVAGDWTRSDGHWLLTPIDGGEGTHVEYRLDAEIEGGLPAVLSRAVLRDRVRRTLAALRRVAEGRS